MFESMASVDFGVRYCSVLMNNSLRESENCRETEGGERERGVFKRALETQSEI